MIDYCWKCKGKLEWKRSLIGSIDPYCPNCDEYFLDEWIDNPYIKLLLERIKELEDEINGIKEAIYAQELTAEEFADSLREDDND